MLDVRIEDLFLLCGCNDVCYEVSIRFRTKINFPLEVRHNRGLVLTTTSDRSSISDNGSVNDWCQRKLNPKLENLMRMLIFSNQVKARL